MSTEGPIYGETIVNKIEKFESAEGKEVICDAIVEKHVQSVQSYWICEGYCNISIRRNWLIIDKYCMKDKYCCYYKKEEHIKNDCPKLKGKRSEKQA